MGVAAAARLAPFLPRISPVVDTAPFEQLSRQLRSCVLASPEAFDQHVRELPSDVSGPDPEAWRVVPAGSYLAMAHVVTLLNCLDFATTDRRWVHIAFACGGTIEALGMWAEYVLDAQGADGSDEVAWHAGKYAFWPVAAEVGAQRIDWVVAMREGAQAGGCGGQGSSRERVSPR